MKENQLVHAIRTMIDITDDELSLFLARTSIKNIKMKTIVNSANKIMNEIYFINSGLFRVFITDNEGTEHTIHFALENQFISDYTSFLLKSPSHSSIQALENMEVVVIDRETIEWGYQFLKEGQKLGRLIAEYYFIYQDTRIVNQYALTPKQRYDAIATVFPNIHNRAPQYMIASYLGITPIHLSRLKRESFRQNKI